VIIVLKLGATDEQLRHVVERIEAAGCRAHISRGEELTIVGCIGDDAKVERLNWQAMPGVERAERVTRPYKLASRQFQPHPTVVQVGSAQFGAGRLTVIAGPCTVEDEQMLWAAAEAVRQAGAHMLRGGAFKPRTSPYDFQGLGEDGLRLLQKAGRRFGLPVVTEVRTPAHVPPACAYADMLQVGARNMQNYDLLLEVGRSNKPVLLKRGFSATVRELLLAAEYILSTGNRQVVLCERGIRTFETSTRFTLDVSAIPVLKQETHLPVIFDPSHAAGRAALVPALARAGVAAGADGLIVEIHCNPEEAQCDGEQALRPDGFAALMTDLFNIHQALRPAG
jgi:3-deoxy-7-phosphoheptulonate synthase